jgi:hypothetical protein
MRELVTVWLNVPPAGGPFSKLLLSEHANEPVAVNTEMRLLFGFPSVKNRDAPLDTTLTHVSPKIRSCLAGTANPTAFLEHAPGSGGVYVKLTVVATGQPRGSTQRTNAQHKSLFMQKPSSVVVAWVLVPEVTSYW